MTTTDTALVEQIARALKGHDPERMECSDHDGSCCPSGHHDLGASRYGHLAAAVLPIIRKAERDAAREALDGLAAQEAELHSRDLDVYKECDHAAMVAKLYRDTHYPEDVTP